MNEQHGSVCWSELMTRDVEKVKAYYSTMCGWTFETMDMGEGDYHIASLDGTMVAGVMDMADMPGTEGQVAQWMTYIAVDDVDAAAKQTEAQGGTVFKAPWDVPGVGRIAMIADPGGAALGIMTPSE